MRHRELLDDGTCRAEWAHPDDDRLLCNLCPRHCRLADGDRGFCFVRENRDGQMVLSTYGRSTGFCIDPIEKKPLNHFYPGTSVLSFGTAGCNLGCKFCQNWDISKSREVSRLSQIASPAAIADAAHHHQCTSVAFTYNDPVIWAEYAIDTAIECHARDLKTVAVTAGYITEQARGGFFEHIDAANVDLKSFSEEFYSKITYSHLNPVLDTLRYLVHETSVWVEITNLVIPDTNDSGDEISRMCDWIVEHLTPTVPVHFSAFHPDFRMQDRPATPPETLFRVHAIAKSAGLHHAYVGNVHDLSRQSTYCSNCKSILIERDWYQLGRYNLRDAQCVQCGETLVGHFGRTPGNWGRKRLPIQIPTTAKPMATLTMLDRESSSTTVLTRRNFQNTRSPVESRTMDTTNEPNAPSESQQNPPQHSTSDDSAATTSESTSQPALAIHELDQTAREQIVSTASQFVVANVCNTGVPKELIDALGSIGKSTVMGLFVTLKRGDQLRGCCGMIGQPIPLVDALFHASQRTAKEDRRFPPVARAEVAYLNIDVTLLGEPEVIRGNASELPSQIEIGKHGLKITSGQNAGLLLPTVATDNNWDAEQFLDAVCRKAGLASNAWKDPNVILERFEGVSSSGIIDPAHVEGKPLHDEPMLTAQDVVLLRGYVAQNLTAMLQGSTPSYVLSGVSDGTVNGLVLSLLETEKKKTLAHLIRISLRPGMPLQSSLFELTQTAAKILEKAQLKGPLKLELALTVLHDPALHGQVQISRSEADGPLPDNCHLEGFDTKKRAVVAMMGGDRVSVCFEGSKTPEDLVRSGVESLSAHGRPVAIYSMQYLSTRPYLVASSSPAGQTGPGTRAPAFSGAFYPSSDSERQDLVDGLLLGKDVSPKDALAVMVPHAALRYSGRIAAETLRRVRFPSSLLLIGPKHTPQGVDWALAPYRKWRLSAKSEFQSDQELTKLLADNIDGLQLDAAAHAREHGCEIQLPLLERLAPKCRITSIAMHGGNWNEIQHAAKQLADILRSLSEMPLLVISSDMNHYAPVAENRRKDRLAMDAIKTCDPEKLLTVCSNEKISMCGVLPAAWIMQTLHELGKEYQVEDAGYATSADSGGDRNRVVGYSGMLFTEK